MVIVDTKKCNKCGEHKLINKDFWHKKKGGKFGFEATCRICRTEYFREYSRKNRELIAEKSRERYKKNPEYFKNYYEDKKSKILSQRKQYRKENKEILSEYHQVYRSENAEKISNYKSIWRRVNSDKVNISRQRRRARLKHLPNDFTASDNELMMKYFQQKCCLSSSDLDIQLDHAMPISKGGGTTKGNMIPLNSSLNSSKGNQNIFEWFEKNKEKLNVEKEMFDKTIEYLARMNNESVAEYRERYEKEYKKDDCYVQRSAVRT